MHSPVLGKALLIAVLALFYFIARGHHAPPAPVSHDAPPSLYSAERAFEHIRHIAEEPHPAGSARADKVRDYIFRQIQHLGLEPEIQESVVYVPPATFASVHNVVARLEGTSGTNDAVALMAHYDSVVFGPGAADDGSGVAAMLEAMRALHHENNTANDVIFIFTDGEEGRAAGGTGLRGAYAFATHHPWMQDIRTVINFDARGIKGASYMYQTSGKNAWLIKQLARSRCKAAATSLGYEVYNRMPVYSDLTAFINAGVPGYDCAFIHGLEKYHTMLDSPDNLSLASLQHHGEYALKLTRHLANQPLADAANITENLVFFDFPGNRIIYYSERVAALFILLVFVVYVFLLVVGLRNGELTVRGLLGAAAAYLSWFLFCCGMGALVMIVGYRLRDAYILYSSDEFTLGVLLICGGATILTINRIADRTGFYNAVLGLLAPWVLFMVATPFFVPGASYVFTWTLLLAMLPIGAGLLRRHTTCDIGTGGALLLAVSAFPTILFTIGILTGFYAALSFIFLSLHVGIVLFAAALLTPHILLLTGTIRGRVSTVLFALGVLFLLVGILWPGFSAQQPKFNSITYGLNADTGEAVYMSCDDAVDSWTEQFLGTNPQRLPITQFIPFAERTYLQAPAPVLPLEAPTLEVLEDTITDNRRTLRLRVHSPRGAEVVEVYAMPETPVLAANVNGIDMETGNAPWRLSYSIYRGDGITIKIVLPADAPARFRVADHRYYLENILAFEPRPPHYIPKPNTIDFNRDPLKSEESILVKTFDIPLETSS